MPYSFLESLLETAEFPGAVIPSILDTYERRFTVQLARNTTLGAYYPRLLTAEPSPIIALTMLLRNYAGLSAVLDTALLDATMIKELLEYWCLSPEDQLRLVSRDLDPSSIEALLCNNNINSPTARAHLISAGSPSETAGCDPEDFVGRGVSVEKTTWSSGHPPSAAMDSDQWNDVVLKVKLSEFMYVPKALWNISNLLATHLGVGNDETSLRSWMLFLSLSENKSEAELGTLFDVAKRLAHAE